MKLEFYNVKTKKKFTTDKYEVKTTNVKGNKRKFAVAISPEGTKCYRILPN